MPGKVDTEGLLIGLALESWRLSRAFHRSMDTQNLRAATRQSSQIRYFHKKLEDALSPLGLSIVDLEGQKYDVGMAAAALNVGDFSPDDTLIVDQMLEPIVMDAEGIRRTGTMMLRKI